MAKKKGQANSAFLSPAYRQPPDWGPQLDYEGGPKSTGSYRGRGKYTGCTKEELTFPDYFIGLAVGLKLAEEEPCSCVCHVPCGLVDCQTNHSCLECRYMRCK